MGSKTVMAVLAFCGTVTIAAVVGVLVVAEQTTSLSAANPVATTVTVKVEGAIPEFSTMKPPAGNNVCEGKKVYLPNGACEELETPQAGSNVTKGYVGDLVVDYDPITNEYFKNSMCPVNVHWHLGTEHLSVGEYDEDGTGPHSEDYRRDLAEGKVRGGHRCNLYDKNVEMFNKPYDWKHCVNMEVGETYEVHWPHSAAGACGTVNQYQTPFYDGVFCDQDLILNNLGSLPQLVGVQAQIFTIVNDESYYYPDLMRGMIIDKDFGKDIAKYTGSTTGTSRDADTICSAYSPITWQVDRKCHMISASSFDKMCADMKSQRDDMSDDLYPHGAREVVVSDYVANNQHDRALRGAN